MTKWTIRVRIYYEDTDFSGVVYHANYLRYFERGRTEALREATGLGHGTLFDAKDPVAFTARQLEISYDRPARIDDLLTIETSVVDVRGARMVFAQRAIREGDVLASAKVTIACMDPKGRPRRLPKKMLDMIALPSEE
ncbi:MAG: tol-pal system-associated acyl-CoA thioesterase [Pseudomonadota bacterium]